MLETNFNQIVVVVVYANDCIWFLVCWKDIYIVNYVVYSSGSWSKLKNCIGRVEMTSSFGEKKDSRGGDSW